MLVLLPPSRSMLTPATGDPYSPACLSFPELGAVRAEVAARLVAACAAPDAAASLGFGPRLAGEVAANATLATRPALPAAQAYTGVLYAAAGWPTAPQHVGGPEVVIASALYGFVRPSDIIAPYRLTMHTPLPGTPLAATWRPAASAALAELGRAHTLVLDCRSSEYAAAAPAKVLAGRVLAVRAVTRRAGKEVAVSHDAKRYRGLLLGALCARDVTGWQVADVAELAGQLPAVQDVRLDARGLTLVV
ncbi:peroxide stress protein YaaA [Buchananella hordeovulneris]|uniref:YaaA family protein n=1 Tax=Buchananella hordeovulneris TaxID=52770 RepID=UPI000F5FD78B|nr:peroxide stress protein YaaA [Buchananella hordeovulneris]RRD51746.1 peroxide stress protein YaaA [Buchananella hordeovulneris]